jgi:predicted secreted protein
MNPTRRQFSLNGAASKSKFLSVTGKLGTLLRAGRQLPSSRFLAPAAQAGVVGWMRSGTIGFLGVLVEAAGPSSPRAPARDDHWTLPSGAGTTKQVVGDAGSVVVPAEKAIITVTENKNGQEISLGMGDTLEVRLVSQPGTGYGWQVADPLPGMLRLVEKGLDLGGSGQAPSAPGALATAVFRFVPVGAGTGDLRLVYVRPWEKESAPKKAYTLHVRVRLDAPGDRGRSFPASEKEVL